MRYGIRPLVTIAILALCGCSSQPDPNSQASNLRISTLSDPDSLDPRIARDLASASALHMIYEGLMRIDNTGQLRPGMAKSYEVSPDHRTYTFHLRDAAWSNGDPVTADDFAYTWRSVLDPSFPAPNAFQLFVIKNAAAAKRGEIPLDAVGMRALDPRTLQVTLEKPTAHFLELTAFHALFPINSRVDRQNASWAAGDHKALTSNGPFQLDHWHAQYELVFVPNPHYWDRNAIQLANVTLIPVQEDTALRLYEMGKLDWVGSPLSTLPPDAIATLKAAGTLEMAPAAGTHWFRLNTALAPLDDPRIRKALALAIDRKALVEHILQGNQQPAMAVVPSGHQWKTSPYFHDHDVTEARRLLQSARGQKRLEPLTLTYSSNERNHKFAQAIQQQWREGLGIDVTLEAVESKLFYEKLKNGQYQIANGSWFADFCDPISFLNVFKERANGTNNTGWEDPTYRSLLTQAAEESDPDKRTQLLQKSESILMEQMPVIPLFFTMYNFQKSPNVKGVGLSELGILNVRNAEVIP